MHIPPSWPVTPSRLLPACQLVSLPTPTWRDSRSQLLTYSLHPTPLRLQVQSLLPHPSPLSVHSSPPTLVDLLILWVTRSVERCSRAWRAATRAALLATTTQASLVLITLTASEEWLAAPPSEKLETASATELFATQTLRRNQPTHHVPSFLSLVPSSI